MNIPKAPSWKVTIFAGLMGGLANVTYDSEFLGIFVWISLTALLMLLGNARKQRLAHPAS